MRKDQYNNKVKPRPIYNTGETSFPMRYQYLSDWYNTDNKWENLKADSCAKLDLSEYISNYDDLLESIETSLTPEYQEYYQKLSSDYERNKQYEIGSFIRKREIEELLRLQIEELDKLSSEKLYKLSLSDIEEYYIRYESNLPDFRLRMYGISDWTRKEEKTVNRYDKGLIDFFRKVLGIRAADVWELYGFDDEVILMSYTVEGLIEILEEQGISESNIIQFKGAISKFEEV